MRSQAGPRGIEITCFRIDPCGNMSISWEKLRVSEASNRAVSTKREANGARFFKGAIRVLERNRSMVTNASHHRGTLNFSYPSFEMTLITVSGHIASRAPVTRRVFASGTLVSQIFRI